MDSLERDMGWIVGALADVDHIAFGNTILALNAKIEAAHIGERGAGFELVAQELWSQARKSQEITEGIRTTILRLAGDAKAAETEDWRRWLAPTANRIAELQEARCRQRSAAWKVLMGTCRNPWPQPVRGAKSLAGEIASAVQTMQFQDRLGQRIVHIVEALESMHKAIEEQFDPLGRRPDS